MEVVLVSLHQLVSLIALLFAQTRDLLLVFLGQDRDLGLVLRVLGAPLDLFENVLALHIIGFLVAAVFLRLNRAPNDFFDLLKVLLLVVLHNTEAALLARVEGRLGCDLVAVVAQRALDGCLG